LDDARKIVKEVKVASEPQALLKVLGNPAYASADLRANRIRSFRQRKLELSRVARNH
jgi:hypothetical protein